MAKFYEVRYRKNEKEIVAHQHATENGAKMDAKQVSKNHGRCMLGEIDDTNNHMIRAVEFAGGVQGKWMNRSDAVSPCTVLLTIEDTKIDEPAVDAKPKIEYTEEQIAERKEALRLIREAQKAKESKKPSTKSENSIPDKKEKLLKQGIEPALVDLICNANVHIDSPNFDALKKLWVGPVDIKDFPGMKQRDLNSTMTKLRAILMSNPTDKSIANKMIGSTLVFKLIDFKMEITEDEVA